jgi:hypothetical protein
MLDNGNAGPNVAPESIWGLDVPVEQPLCPWAECKRLVPLPRSFDTEGVSYGEWQGQVV